MRCARLSGVLVLLATLAACGDDAPRRDPVDEAAPADVAWPPPGANGGFSNDGSFYVTWSARPSDVPLNENFEVVLRIWDAATRTEIGADAELAVDARMPAHGHGMNQAVELVRGEDGAVTVRGMLFHMTGHWELYVDLTRGAVTERCQFDVDLE